MAIGFQEPRYALFMFTSDDEQVNGTSVHGDIQRVRLLAKSTLFLMPSVAYIHIHAYGEGEMVAPQALERVDWDQEF